MILSSINNILTKFIPIPRAHANLLYGRGPDDEGTPDRILHLLDAGVHVVEGDGGGGGGGHVGAGAGEVPGGHDKLLSETHHSAVGCY